MTSRHFGVSRRKKLKLLIAGTFSALILAFSIGFMFSVVPTEVADEYTLNAAKLFAISIPVFVGFSGIWYLFAYMFCKSEGFYFDEGRLHYYFTFVIKRRVSLPLEKINVTKLKRSLLDLILDTAVLEFGSGSMTTSMRAEIKLCLNNDDAKYFLDYVKRYSKATKAGQAFDEEVNFAGAKAADDDKDCRVIKMTKADKLKMIFVNPIVSIVALLSLPISIVPFFAEQDGAPLKHPYAGLIVCASIIALTVLCLFIYAFVALYNYTVRRKGDDIIIHYGLISIKTFSVPVDKIHGYTVGQTLLRQIFGLGSMCIIAVGIDEVNSQNGGTTKTYAYPCGGLKKLTVIAQTLLPEFAGLELKSHGANGDKNTMGSDGLTRSTGQSVLHSVVIPTSVTALLFLPFLLYLGITVSIWVLVLPLLAVIALCMFRGLMVFYNAGFALDESFVRATSGGLYKAHTVVRTRSVQEISTYAGFIRRRQGLCTYKIIYRGSSMLRLFVRNIPSLSLDSLN